MTSELLFAAAIIAAVIAARYFGTRRQLLGRLLSTPRTAIAQLKPAIVARVVGRAVAGDEPLMAPLSGRACVYYYAHCEEERSTTAGRGHTSSSWETIRACESSVPFTITDGTGQAVVVPVGAWIMISTVTGPFDVARRRSFLAGVSNPAAGDLRFREGVIVEGDVVTVLGEGKPEPADPAQSSPYRGAPVRIRFEATPRCRVIISDDPKTTGPRESQPRVR
jgi:hypothetical protein